METIKLLPIIFSVIIAITIDNLNAMRHVSKSIFRKNAETTKRDRFDFIEFVATHKGRENCNLAVQDLIDAGEDLNAYDNNGFTLLHQAVDMQNKDMVDALVWYNGKDIVNVNLQTYSHTQRTPSVTPLYLAIRRNHLGMFYTLLAAGACVLEQDIDLARSLGSSHLLIMLVLENYLKAAEANVE